MQIPLGLGAFSRPYGNLPTIQMVNRFFETNPLGAEQTSLLSRPGSRLFLEVGDGPLRTMYSHAGVFSEDLFIVSGEEFFRYDGTTTTPILGTVAGDAWPVMTSVSIPGWQAIFITDGVTLQHYEGISRATATLTIAAPGIAAGEGVVLGTVHYEFTAGSVDAGTPQGTLANPWLVALGTDDAESLANLFDAINDSGTPGTTYSLGLEVNPDARARKLEEDSFEGYAYVGGAGGNSLASTETSAALSWSGATLSGGGVHTLKPCSVPDDVPIVDLATLAGYVVGVQGASHKFFWIHPGETDIEPLSFSSAEYEPDDLVGAMAVGDQLWLFGQSSVEAWYASGDAEQPFLRTQGRAFSQGVIPNTIARNQDEIVLVGQDRVAYRIAGTPERISHHGIEEKLRRWQGSL